MAWAEDYFHTKCILIHPAVWSQYMGQKFGGCCAPSFFWGEGKLSHHVTQCRLGRGLPPYQVHLDPSSRLGTIDMGRKLGAVPPFWGRGPGSLSSTLSPGLRHTKCDLDASSHLATIKMGQTLGGSAPFFGGRELGPYLAHCRLGRGLHSYQVTS